MRRHEQQHASWTGAQKGMGRVEGFVLIFAVRTESDTFDLFFVFG
jgi:hypothetical protein